MAFGIGVDAHQRLLWAVSTAEPVMKGFTDADAKRAGLFAFRLDTGALARKITAEADTPAHYFNDLTVRSDGRVFLSDGGQGLVYTVGPDSRDLETLVPQGTIQGSNGLALSADERTLYIAYYARFIFRVDLESRAASSDPDGAVEGRHRDRRGAHPRDESPVDRRTDAGRRREGRVVLQRRQPRRRATRIGRRSVEAEADSASDSSARPRIVRRRSAIIVSL
jgi:SMP-30/Gluconolactonase/LRE-like region